MYSKILYYRDVATLAIGAAASGSKVQEVAKWAEIYLKNDVLCLILIVPNVSKINTRVKVRNFFRGRQF